MNTFKGFVTKWALTKGIIEMELRETEEYGVVSTEYFGFPVCITGEEENWNRTNWHRTRISAVVRAEMMRRKKIHSLETQIAKLKQLKFE